MNETYSICAHEFNVSSSQTMIERRMRPLLSLLSRAHEYDDRFTLTGQLWTDSEEHMVTRWSFAAAVLYALTVITSTGYDHVTPSTDPGRIFTVFFGLVGIPLMFITAADIGKFLSEVVIRSYGKLLELFTWIGSVIDAIRDYVNDENDSIDSRKRRGSRRVSILDEEDDDEDRLQLPIASYFALIIGYCAIGSLLFNAFEKGPIWKRRGSRRVSILDEEDDDEDRLQLPIASYFALIIGYCAIGSLLFNAFEKGPIWSFMHGLFFSFNTITTIGLGNIYVRDQFYLALIVAYVIIGLAVITASLDLCSSTLKRTFTKLHYFGRKIRGARRGFANMSDDIREAMRIIAALKKTRPSKERITLEDLKRFLEVQEHLIRQPYVPYNVHIFRWIEDARGNSGVIPLRVCFTNVAFRPSKERITLEDLKRFLEVQEHLIRQPYVPYNVHIFRWIEDAYAQYFDETGTIGEKDKMRSKEPILFF
uniref:Ion_trans_2 domain-containing protein n=1 Tax=Ascaris lumbricoides TaxID=6252 RepID=A0A0M3IKW1_ASCLU